VTAGWTLTGTPAAPGRARGPLFVVPEAPAGASAEGAGMDAMRAAAERAAARLEDLAGRRRAGSPAAADILEAQAMILRDPALEAATEELLRTMPVAGAVAGAAERYAAELEALADPYLRERAADVREAGRLLVAELAGAGGSRLAGLRRPSIVVARELSPADTLSVEPAHLLGLVTETGGRTAHTAIVARELGIPAVVGVEGAVAAAAGAEAAEVDGDAGGVRLLAVAPAVDRGGRAARPLAVARAPVRLMANVGSEQAARVAAERGAAGVGLFRTEFLFLGQAGLPGEDQQAGAYAAACRALHPHPVTVRTLDAGSDKALPALGIPPEPNPALGRRGIRLWLAHRELWEPQVRALVRVASEHGNLRVMLPMVGTADEIGEARARLRSEARRRRAAPPPLGMMVELPAVAAALGAFAGLVEFVSLGTNDLAQYALGADRELEWPAGLSEFHPGVLRLIATCLGEAARLGLEAGVCGEMAGMPEGAVFLAGAGATSLSMAVSSLPGVLRTLTRLGPERSRAATSAALAAADAAAARRALRRA
jgi:phosphotransferase system enzyme I (PtsI)